MKKTVPILLILTLCCAMMNAFAAGTAALPAYAYTGDDPVVCAVAEAIVSNAPLHELYPDSVLIPAPVILKTVPADDTHMSVYGNFWYMRYVQEGSQLTCVSGGEAPGVMQLEKTTDGWKAVSVELAGDGSEYGKDIQYFCKGDRELETAYYDSADAGKDPLMSVRTQLIREYVQANGLAIEAYADYGWEPVKLFE